MQGIVSHTWGTRAPEGERQHDIDPRPRLPPVVLALSRATVVPRAARRATGRPSPLGTTLACPRAIWSCICMLCSLMPICDMVAVCRVAITWGSECGCEQRTQAHPRTSHVSAHLWFSVLSLRILAARWGWWRVLSKSAASDSCASLAGAAGSAWSGPIHRCAMLRYHGERSDATARFGVCAVRGLRSLIGHCVPALRANSDRPVVRLAPLHQTL